MTSIWSWGCSPWAACAERGTKVWFTAAANGGTAWMWLMASARVAPDGSVWAVPLMVTWSKEVGMVVME